MLRVVSSIRMSKPRRSDSSATSEAEHSNTRTSTAVSDVRRCMPVDGFGNINLSFRVSPTHSRRCPSRPSVLSVSTLTAWHPDSRHHCFPYSFVPRTRLRTWLVSSSSALGPTGPAIKEASSPVAIRVNVGVATKCALLICGLAKLACL
ncbi:hypothetical protein BHM03_00020936 [Ensete ventricosum]|nr:hypothetical protein BHM03_00020936 [Ensete ventricosum]